MNYHQWPSQGTGTVSYEWNGQTLSMDLGATTFAWDDMLDSYPTATTGTDAQRQAVATLMKACGYALHMTYGLAADGGSGAMAFNIPAVLVDHFGYDAAIHYECPDYYSPEQWEQMIYDNLANIGPLVYGGHGDGGGHSFVCDGYDSNGLFHINWGWGGSSDGYFLLSALDPSNLGAGGGSGGYNTNPDAILGIQKPQSGSAKPLPFIGCRNISHLYAQVDSPYLSVYGYPTDNDLYTGFNNAGVYAGVFFIGLKVVKEDSDNETMILPRNNDKDTNRDGLLEPGRGADSFTFMLPTDIAEGSYKAYPVYKLEDSQWENIKLPYGIPDYISFSVKGGRIYLDKNSVKDIYVGSVECPTGLIIGKPYTINFTAINTLGKTTEYTLQAILCEPNSTLLIEDLESTTVTLNPEEPTHVSISGTLSDTATEGEYNLSIADGSSYNIYITRVTVTDSSSRDETTEDASAANAIQWYDLSGRPVNPANLSQGIYIKTDGLHTEKVVIK